MTWNNVADQRTKTFCFLSVAFSLGHSFFLLSFLVMKASSSFTLPSVSGQRPVNYIPGALACSTHQPNQHVLLFLLLSRIASFSLWIIWTPTSSSRLALTMERRAHAISVQWIASERFRFFFRLFCHIRSLQNYFSDHFLSISILFKN